MKRFDHKLDFKNGLMIGVDMHIHPPKCTRCFDTGLVIGMDGRVTNCTECELGKQYAERYAPRTQYVPIKTPEDIEKEAKEAEKEAFTKETERLIKEAKPTEEKSVETKPEIIIKKKGRPAKDK